MDLLNSYLIDGDLLNVNKNKDVYSNATGVYTNDDVISLKNKISIAKAKIQSLYNLIGGVTPMQRKGIQREIDDLKSSLSTMSNELGVMILSMIDTSTVNEGTVKSLEDSIEALNNKIQSLANLIGGISGSQFNIMRQEIDANNNLLNGMIEKLAIMYSSLIEISNNRINFLKGMVDSLTGSKLADVNNEIDRLTNLVNSTQSKLDNIGELNRNPTQSTHIVTPTLTTPSVPKSRFRTKVGKVSEKKSLSDIINKEGIVDKVEEIKEIKEIKEESTDKSKDLIRNSKKGVSETVIYSDDKVFGVIPKNTFYIGLGVLGLGIAIIAFKKFKK